MREKALAKRGRGKKSGKLPSNIVPNRPGKWYVTQSDGYRDWIDEEFNTAHEAWAYVSKMNAGVSGEKDYEMVHEDDYEDSDDLY